MDNYSDDNELIEAMKTSNPMGVSLDQIKEFVKLMGIKKNVTETTQDTNTDNYSDDQWDIDEYTPSPQELKDLMNQSPYKSEAAVCIECGEEIPPSTRKFSVEAGRIHEDCYKPSNLVPIFPIGCEDLYRKS